MQKICINIGCGKAHASKQRDLCKSCFDAQKTNPTLSINQRLVNLSQDSSPPRPSPSAMNQFPNPRPRFPISAPGQGDVQNTYFSLFDQNPPSRLGTSLPSLLAQNNATQEQIQPNRDGMNEYLENNMQNTTPPQNNNIDRPVTVRDIMNIIKPLENKIDNLHTTMNQRLTTVETQNKALENEVRHQKHKNEVLTGIVTDMQRVMNGFDSDKRNKNIIIAGLSEEDVTIGGEQLTNDTDKMECILKEIGLEDITRDEIENFQFIRIGEPVADQSRYLKVTVHSKETRDKICEKSPSLKTKDDPLKKVYINKDTHPVYLNENKRLRKAMKDLKNKPGFEHQTGRVKIVGNELKVDGITVDRNSFF